MHKELPLQPQVFLFDATSFALQHFGNYLSFISSPLKLFQVGWGQTHIFRFLQKYSIRFKSRLWLGHSKAFTELCISHSCCVFRFIVLLEGEPSVQSEVLNALDWVFIKAISTLLSTLLDSIIKKKKLLSLFQNLHLSLYLSLLPLLACIYLNNVRYLVLLALPLYVCLFKINRFMYSPIVSRFG